MLKESMVMVSEDKVGACHGKFQSSMEPAKLAKHGACQ